MTTEKGSPRVTPDGERAAEARRRRLAEELRANLGKRKAQARARSSELAGDAGEAPDHADGPGDGPEDGPGDET